MSSDFIVCALEDNQFSQYFDLPEEKLTELGAYLFVADQSPCYPCRVSLIDAEVGENVLAISYEHHVENSAYRSSGPIFVRQTAQTVELDKNEIPQVFNNRLLSVRGYNGSNLMIEAETAVRDDIQATLFRFFDNSDVHYIHVHNAGPGCFSCSVKRA